MDPITTKALITVGKLGVTVATKLRELEEKNTKHFRETATEEYLTERAHAFAKSIARLEQENQSQKRVEELFTDEFWFLQKNYEFEAIFKEARVERRRMLACAAGAIDPSMALRDVCRVERTLRMLEPDDVRCLGYLAAIPATLEPRQHEDGAIQVYKNTPPTARLAAARARQLSFDALLAAGCLRQEDPNEDDVEDAVVVTEIGRLVLRVLGDYLAMQAAEDVANAK